MYLDGTLIESELLRKWIILFFQAASSVQFSHSVVSDSLRPLGLQHTRSPCPSPTPRAYSDSCPSHQWCHPTISSSIVPLLLLPSIIPSIRVFSNELVLCIRWPKYWSFSFSISPSNEYSGLVGSPCCPKLLRVRISDSVSSLSFGIYDVF